MLKPYLELFFSNLRTKLGIECLIRAVTLVHNVLHCFVVRDKVWQIGHKRDQISSCCPLVGDTDVRVRRCVTGVLYHQTTNVEVGQTKHEVTQFDL